MISFGFMLIAIALLALSMHKHYKASFDTVLTNKKSLVLKYLGWGILVLSFVLISPSPINYVTWFCQLSLVIFFQAWLLAKWQKIKKIE